jgi:hypothetical protein
MFKVWRQPQARIIPSPEAVFSSGDHTSAGGNGGRGTIEVTIFFRG